MIKVFQEWAMFLAGFICAWLEIFIKSFFWAYVNACECYKFRKWPWEDR